MPTQQTDRETAQTIAEIICDEEYSCIPVWYQRVNKTAEPIEQALTRARLEGMRTGGHRVMLAIEKANSLRDYPTSFETLTIISVGREALKQIKDEIDQALTQANQKLSEMDAE